MGTLKIRMSPNKVGGSTLGDFSRPIGPPMEHPPCSANLKMAIERVDVAIKTEKLPHSFLYVYQRATLLVICFFATTASALKMAPVVNTLGHVDMT